MTKKIVFDVGANTGTSCYSYADDPLTTVYAFEPTPQLLENYLYPKKKENYIVVPYAISDFDGQAPFNIAKQDPSLTDGSLFGCSSLYEFSDNLDQTWPGRQDFEVTQKINVLVRRIDTFIKNNKIEKVDYLHCDTQGNDLTVLKSFGKYISILQSGVVEAVNQNPLYKSVDNSVSSVIKFLEENNFIISGMYSNDIQQNEVNIEFRRK
jgi:FkbM family methyltransferase